jgi:hypothetical protein
MRGVLIATSVLVARSALATAHVHLLITPQSTMLPASGKMVLDVYWYNSGDQAAAVPAMDCYDVSSWVFTPGRQGGSAVGTGPCVDHPAPDRELAPYAVIHDRITIQLELKPAEFAETSLRVTGEHRKHFESNRVLFRRKR